MAETETAKAICGGIPGGGQDRPGWKNSRDHGKGLQKQYAAAYRAAGKTAQAGKTAETTAKAAKKTAQESKRTALFLKRHWKGALIVGGIGLLLVMLLGSLQSCSSMFGGGVSNIMASSYLSEDADMLAAEEAYCAKEDELREYLDTYEATHDYDEYHFNLSHVPVYIMGEDQLSLYATYMSTLGNLPDLFPSSGYVNKYIENPPTAW